MIKPKKLQMDKNGKLFIQLTKSQKEKFLLEYGNVPSGVIEIREIKMD